MYPYFKKVLVLSF